VRVREPTSNSGTGRECPTPAPLLAVEGLSVGYPAGAGEVRVVEGLSFEVGAGSTLGIVGESGAGKTQAMLALMGLLPPDAVVRGSIRFEGAELVGHPERVERLRGRGIALVFQDPASALNPYLTIGTQMLEVLAVHEGLRGRAARARAIAMLDAVQIADAPRRLAQYPHELSGGMRQRALIAMSLLGRPALLVADEPTTALDVTVQAGLLALLESLRESFGLAIVLISHDLGVVARMCDRVAVMYAGRVVEQGSADRLFHGARHPYTQALLRAAPRLDAPRGSALAALPGTPANPAAPPSGCAFHPRCSRRFAPCDVEAPALADVEPGHAAACHLPK
jgi:oligopeptide/dipeptide ABC transporter ATP-binding protein